MPITKNYPDPAIILHESNVSGKKTNFYTHIHLHCGQKYKKLLWRIHHEDHYLLFYGTGNSLAVAKSICTHLGDFELISIASLAGTSGEIQPYADRVGIVCPVFVFGLPSIVAEFVQSLGLSHTGTRYS